MTSWTLGTKMNAGIGVMAVAMLILSAVAVTTVRSLGSALQNAYRVEARQSMLTTRLQTELAQLTASMRGLTLSAVAHDARRVRQDTDAVARAMEAFDKDVKELAPLVNGVEETRALQAVQTAFAAWKQELPSYLELARKGLAEETNRMRTEIFVPLREKLEKETGVLYDRHTAQLAEFERQAKSKATGSLYVLILGNLLALVALALVMFLMWKEISVLRQLAMEIAGGARQVATASEQVSSASQSLAQGASEQAASLEETSASAEEVNSMTQKNAQNARSADDETTRAGVLLKETVERVREMIGSMQKINISSEKISKIIKVIDEIAFQTNILALNAAVEAARAGEAGMGFAVVADEVRNLAQRSAQAARDTAQLIEESISHSKQGKVRLDEVTASVQKVVENSDRIKMLANQMNLGSQEQARGIEQISKAVVQMQQVTQSSAANAEQGASAGEEMSEQAKHLTQAVQRLYQMVGSQEHDGSPEPRAPRRFGLATPPATPRPQPAQREAAVSRPPAKARPAAARRSAIPLEDDFRDF
jgi:methyl-accepting chemotaxis protein